MHSKARRRLTLAGLAVAGGLVVGVVGSRVQSSHPEAASTTTTTLPLELELTQRPCLETVEPVVRAAGTTVPELTADEVVTIASASPEVFPTALVSLGAEGPTLVGTRDGAVFSVEADGGPPQEVLDLRDATRAEGDGGLLNLAVDADRTTLFVLRTATDGATTLTRHRLSAGPRVGRAEEVLRVEQSSPMHAGGALVVLPDGTLLVGIGDGGGLGGPGELAQQVDGLHGKLLRIDPSGDGEQAYRIPPDNPMLVVEDARAEIFAIGLRNPYRAWFDAASERLIVPDVGQSCREEINVVPLVLFPPRNFGWPLWEGTHRFKPEGGAPFGHSPPVYDYLEGCAIIGGYTYRGSALPELDGAYLYGDWCSGWIRALWWDGAGPVTVEELAHVEAPTAIAPDGAGEPWIATAGDGLYRLVRDDASGPPGDGAGVADAGVGGPQPVR